MSDWSIDPRSLHCAHPSGLTAYVDADPTASGALRCIGPFGSARLASGFVREALAALTLQIEAQVASFDQYVVWGAYLDEADLPQHKITILDNACGYIPNISLRTELLVLRQPASLAREWLRLGSALRHKAGFGLSDYRSARDLQDADPALVHPDSIDAQMLRFTELMPEIVAALASDDRAHTPDQPDLAPARRSRGS